MNVQTKKRRGAPVTAPGPVTAANEPVTAAHTVTGVECLGIDEEALEWEIREHMSKTAAYELLPDYGLIYNGYDCTWRDVETMRYAPKPCIKRTHEYRIRAASLAGAREIYRLVFDIGGAAPKRWRVEFANGSLVEVEARTREQAIEYAAGALE